MASCVGSFEVERPAPAATVSACDAAPAPTLAASAEATMRSGDGEPPAPEGVNPATPNAGESATPDRGDAPAPAPAT